MKIIVKFTKEQINKIGLDKAEEQAQNEIKKRLNDEIAYKIGTITCDVDDKYITYTFKPLAVDEYRHYPIDARYKLNRKLNEEDIKHIKYLSKTNMSNRAIANLYGVHPNTIRYHIDEEYRNRKKDESKRNWKTYYDRETHNATTMRWLKRKRNLLANGGIKND